MSNSSAAKKITVYSMIFMIFTTVFGFSNIPTGFMMMGYAAIPWYILAGLIFFIPYAVMVSEYGVAFKEQKGGIFVWMSRSVNTKYGFMGMFMWYAAFIIYFVNVSTAFFMKISAFLFGEDTTASWSLLGLNSTQTVGILGCLMIILVTIISSKGIKNVSIMARIGGTAVIILQVVLVVGGLVVLIGHGGFAQPVNASAFVKSPNPSYGSLISLLSFATMAISAYGGIEATGGLADKIDNPKKLPKAIIGAAIAITIAYAVMILCVGMFTNWQDQLTGDNVNFTNVQYFIMYNLGYKIAETFGVGAAAAASVGAMFNRFYGLANALTTLGSITVFFYGPLTQLIEGTPDEIWPKWFKKRNAKGIPANAMWIQTAVICFLLLLISFGGTSVNSFWNIILLMTNVAMTIPYMFVAGAFPFFKARKEIEKPITIIKSNTAAKVFAAVAVAAIGFANLFTIISPALDGDVTSTILQIVGPALFACVGLLLYGRYKKKQTV